MVRNGYGAKFIWYEMVSGNGTKLQFCGTKWQWYEMVMVLQTSIELSIHVYIYIYIFIFYSKSTLSPKIYQIWLCQHWGAKVSILKFGQKGVWLYFQIDYWAILHMVRNGYGAKYIWYEIVNYGTKWLWCKIHMVRNGKLWYEMVMVQNSYGTKWFLVMVTICNIAQ
jgi:hypothetical protein